MITTDVTKTVLICDDNLSVHESLSLFLKEEGIDFRSAFTGAELMIQFQNHPIDLILLDIMLPDLSGTDLCKRIRQTSTVPIIFLSARGEEIDRVLGLEIGADDYVTKPFSAREVTLRIKKLLNRNSPVETNDILQYGNLSIDPQRITAWIGSEKLDMTAKEIALLSYLVLNDGKVLNREQILHNVWGYSYYGDTRAVDAVVKRIRRKLPQNKIDFEIQSVYGVGYKLGKKGSQ